MNSTVLFWISMTAICLLVHGFYSMMEMACVSFNRLRLQYHMSRGHKRMQWLFELLQSPYRLFGTTLLCINIALQIGSECSRNIYMSLGLSPDLAPLTQVLLVVIIAELTPMFAARRHAEHVVMLGIPILYASSKLLKPFIHLLAAIARLAKKLFFKHATIESNFLMQRDELIKTVEGLGEQETSERHRDEFTRVVHNIFSFKVKRAQHIMEPLNSIQLLPSNCTVGYMRNILKQTLSDTLPVYHKERANIIGIASPRDYLTANNTTRIREHITPPWFLSYDTPITDILQEFRRNNENLAIILDQAGSAIGIIELQDVLEEIFEEKLYHTSSVKRAPESLIERTLPANMTIEEFNTTFATKISIEGVETLAQLLSETLGHSPQKGESIRIDRFELTVEETTLRGAKTLSVKSLV